MLNHPLPRIDKDEKLRKMLLPYCRFKEGTIWIDEKAKHKIACVDVGKSEEVKDFWKKQSKTFCSGSTVQLYSIY